MEGNLLLVVVCVAVVIFCDEGLGNDNVFIIVISDKIICSCYVYICVVVICSGRCVDKIVCVLNECCLLSNVFCIIFINMIEIIIEQWCCQCFSSCW